MLQVIRNSADLPTVGSAHEYLRMEFKKRVDRKNALELAKDVGAFANSVGGTILVGAVSDGERLARYDPMEKDESQETLRAFDLAVRDLCSPRPLIELHEIAKDDGFVLAVNVWGFPGQPVGVGVDGKSVAKSKHFFFPFRSGSHVVALLPEQLPMMMLPEIRRVAILLAQIPPSDRGNVTLQGLASAPGGMVPFKSQFRLDLDLEALTMRNTVHFSKPGGSGRIAIPADSITRVWQSGEGHWTISAKVSMKSDGRQMDVIPWD